MLVDERRHERLERRAAFVERGDRLLTARLAGTDVRLLVADEVGGGEEPVLEVVDAELGGFAVGDGTEMTVTFMLRRCASSIAAFSAAREICM